MSGVRWGVLSTARITDALIQRGGARFAAVASRSLERAQAWARERDVPRAYGSYEELLADPEIDAVYVPLPNARHVEWSIRALQAGKHVLCEKPLTRSTADAERAFDAAERADRLLVEAFMWRHHPQVDQALELLADGEIGRLRLVRAAFSFPLADPANVRLRADLDGGVLMDVGCYCVHGARTLAGDDPVSAVGEQVLGGGGVDVGFAGALRFPDGVLATFDCSFDVGRRGVLEAIGTEGRLVFTDPWHALAPALELHRGDGVDVIAVEPAQHYARQLADFEAAARGDRAPLLGRADAVGQARTLEALYASAGRA